MTKKLLSIMVLVCLAGFINAVDVGTLKCKSVEKTGLVITAKWGDQGSTINSMRAHMPSLENKDYVLPVSTRVGLYRTPKIALLEPSGPYSIGEVHVEFADQSRTMKPSALPGPRKIAARVFYPIDAKPDEEAKPYLSVKAANYLISDLRDADYRMPAGLGAGWEQYVKTHSYLDQPISKAKASWPTLIHTHGLNSLVELGQSFIEDIVSHGFIVIAFETTNIAGCAVFPDNSVIYSAKPPQGTDFWQFVMGQFDDVVGDFGFILNSVQKTKGKALGDQFVGKIDHNAIGAMGISFGGGAALDFAARNSAVKSAVNLDGSIFKPLQAGTHKPRLLNVFSEGHNEGDPSIKVAMGFVEIAGSAHENFGDTPYLLKAFEVENRYPAQGAIDPSRHIIIARKAILAHFLQTLAVAGQSSYVKAMKDAMAGFKEVSTRF